MYESEDEENKLDNGVLLMWCKVASFVPQHDALFFFFK